MLLVSQGIFVSQLSRINKIYVKTYKHFNLKAWQKRGKSDDLALK